MSPVVSIRMIIFPEMIPDMFRNIFILPYFPIAQQPDFQKGTLRVIAHCLNKCTVKTDVFNRSTFHKLLSPQFLFFPFVFCISFALYMVCPPSVCKNEFTGDVFVLSITIYIAIVNAGDSISLAFFSMLVQNTYSHRSSIV